MRGKKVKSRNCALASDLVRVLSAGLPLRCLTLQNAQRAALRAAGQTTSGNRFAAAGQTASGKGDARVEFLRLKCVSD